MDFQTTITFAVAVFALAIKPGPGMMTIISRTMAFGMSACFTFLAALCIVSVFYLGLVLAGLRFAEEDLVFVSILLKSCAAVYLIYMGVRGLMNPDVELTITDYKEEKLFRNFVGFLMVSLSNPLLIVFYGGLVPSLVDVSTLRFADVVIMASVICAVEIGVAVSYCLPVALSRHVITEGMLRKIAIGSSVILIIIGLYIGYTALPARDVLSVIQ